MTPTKITDERGYIVDRATREAYDRIISAPLQPAAQRSAEAFLRLVERYAAKGVRLL
jgi:hypothetical protein